MSWCIHNFERYAPFELTPQCNFPSNIHIHFLTLEHTHFRCGPSPVILFNLSMHFHFDYVVCQTLTSISGSSRPVRCMATILEGWTIEQKSISPCTSVHPPKFGDLLLTGSTFLLWSSAGVSSLSSSSHLSAGIFCIHHRIRNRFTKYTDDDVAACRNWLARAKSPDATCLHI